MRAKTIDKSYERMLKKYTAQYLGDLVGGGVAQTEALTQPVVQKPPEGVALWQIHLPIAINEG